jgi:hypothetical protein
MTLKEKFNIYCDNLFSSKDVNSDNCVEIADEYAIEFAEWCHTKTIVGADIKKLYKEQLELFKKEKGL